MDLFFKAVTIQARDRAAGVIPDLDEYVVTWGGILQVASPAGH